MWMTFTFIKLFKTSFNDEFTFHKTINLYKMHLQPTNDIQIQIPTLKYSQSLLERFRHYKSAHYSFNLAQDLFKNVMSQCKVNILQH